MDLKIEDNKLTFIPDDIQHTYEDPNGSTWTLGVDFKGAVFILKAPNIDPSFLEYGHAEDIGLPYDVDWGEGVYEVTCAFSTSVDPWSGYVDDWDFEITEHKLLMAII